MRTRQKLLSLLTALLLTVALLPAPAKAAGMFIMVCDESGVTAEEAYVKGSYSWDKSTKTLTMSGMEIDAVRYECSGLLLDGDTTIYLAAGTVNKIRAAYGALYCAASPNGERYNLRIEGSGTLEIITREDDGLRANTLTLAGGSVSIQSNGFPAVRCDTLNISGGSLEVGVNKEISVSGTSVTAIQTDAVTVSGGKLSSRIFMENCAPAGLKTGSYLQSGGTAELDVLDVKNDCSITGGTIKVKLPASSTISTCLTANGALTLKNCSAELIDGLVSAGTLCIDNSTVNFSRQIQSAGTISLSNVIGAKTLNDSQGIPKYVLGEKQPDGSMLIRPSGSTTPAITYSIAYNLNGGQGSTPASGKYEAGSSVQIPAAPIRDGFVFTGWSDGTSVYQPGQSFTMPTANVTLTAQWEAEVPSVLTLDCSAAAVTAKAYDGTTSAAVTGLVFRDEQGNAVKLTEGRDYTISAAFESAAAGIGNPVACTVQFLNSHYTLASGVFTLTGEIKKASVIISAKNETIYLGGSEPVYTYTVTGLANGESLKIPPTVSAKNADVNKAGRYTIEVSGAAVPDTGNYEDTISYKTGILTVQAKESNDDASEKDTDTPPVNAVILSTPSSSAGGSVSVSASSGKRGEKITITVTPKDGYQLESLTVRNAENRVVPVKNQGGGKYTFIMPAMKVSVSANFARLTQVQQTTGTFRDIPSDFWAGNAIQWAYEQGYMNGVGADTFHPNETVTRQQLWMILARHSGKTPADMAAAAAWAYENGVSDCSNPSGAVSRQQLVTILYRYAQTSGRKTGDGVSLKSYLDYGSIANYAAEAMAWAVGNEILTGTAQGTLNPSGTASRAQFAVILMRFCEKNI